MVTRRRIAGIVIWSNGRFDWCFSTTPPCAGRRASAARPETKPPPSPEVSGRDARGRHRAGVCRAPAPESCPRSRPAEESRMAKRSARNAKIVSNHEAKVTNLFEGGWNPLHGAGGHAAGRHRTEGHGRAAVEDRDQ